MEGEELVLIYDFANCDVVDLCSIVSVHENGKLISIFFLLDMKYMLIETIWKIQESKEEMKIACKIS